MKNSLNLAIAVALLVVLGCSCPSKLKQLVEKKNSTPSATPDVRDMPEKSEAPQASDRRNGAYELSMDQYKQINIGMSRNDVERLLGGKGEELSSSSGGGMRFSVNKWEGDSYKSVILTFKNDKVMTKSQVGLK